MNKIFSLHKRVFPLVILFLCNIFLQSCTEEMPIFTPLSNPNTSIIVLNIQNKTYKIANKLPGYVYFANVTVGSGNILYSQYNVSGSNSSSTSLINYLLTFGVNSTNTSQYTVGSSQLTINNKTYSTANANGKAQLQIDSLNTTANTSGGSFAYYLYNSVSAKTDSIYVSGTFNIKK